MITTTDTPAAPRFAHLHLHSEYSLLDGGNALSKLVKHVKALGMTSVAVTDHGNLFGAVEFYTKAKKAGIKPILGIEAYVAFGERGVRSKAHVPAGVPLGGFHLVLLAENLAGWRNLLKLSSDSFINGFFHRPRMDKTTLAQWNDGLIAINGHLGSSLAFHLLQFQNSGNDAHWDAALEEARWHAETFGTNNDGESRFFIELQHHQTPEQLSINPHLIRLARELELPLVCDNDAHFMLKEDWDAHDSLCCISMGKMKNDETRFRYPRDLYVKSAAEMAEHFGDVPEAMENAARIADRCNVELDFDTSHAPVVRVEGPTDPATYGGGDLTEWFKNYCSRFELLPFDKERDQNLDAADLKADCDHALRNLCEAGLIWRYGVDGITDVIRARLERELGVLADKNISAYFLICWDFVNWARQRGIPANARGSGVGTMVGFVLGLSNACPVEYGLLFERFTDPDRSEYPDIDIDICQDGRSKVIEYVRNKYGHVAQIITFGRLKAKAAIKDVARVMGLSPSEGQRLSNLVPNELNITLDQALEKEPELKQQYENDGTIKRLIDTARALEDRARHSGVHAAGVVVATEPLDNIVPLARATGGEDIVTQWDGPTCEKVGLLKMDFLGLRTLSTIERARELIRGTMPDDAIWRAVSRTPPDDAALEAHPLDMDRLQYDDPLVLSLFQRADTAGVFQFESGGMRKLLVEMKPDRLEDLIAANALYRPGPMDLIPDYCQRKHGRQAVPKVHEIVDGFTAETYGIMVYQEQVMQIVHGLGDIPLRAAYSLIKAISKKKHDVINAERPKFIEGAQEKGLSEGQANELFDLILKFAGYGFNKSHSTGYAIVAYQTAYLKTYFPNHYMAALLTFESAARKVDDWVPYLEDCRKTPFPDNTPEQPHIGVEVKPPDINLSAADFTVVYADGEPQDAVHGHVRFGLKAIKNVGSAAIDAIIHEREENGPFVSIFDFCERVNLKSVNKATIEALVKSGAMDSIHCKEHRSAVLASIEDAVAAGQSAAADRAAGQMNFFGLIEESAGAAEEPMERALPGVPAWDEYQALSFEKEVLGFHVSGHPLDRHERTINSICTPVTTLESMGQDAPICVGGVLTRVRPITARNNKRMAVVTVQDKGGSLECVLFADAYAEYGFMLEEDAIVVMIGRVDKTRAEPQVIVETVMPMEQAELRLAGSLELTVIEQNGDAADLERRLKGLYELLHREVAVDANAGAGRAVEVHIHLCTAAKCVTIKPRSLRVVPDDKLLAETEQVLGPGGGAQLRTGQLPMKPRRKRFQKREPAMAGGD